jgi:hypothetical protein
MLANFHESPRHQLKRRRIAMPSIYALDWLVLTWDTLELGYKYESSEADWEGALLAATDKQEVDSAIALRAAA